MSATESVGSYKMDEQRWMVWTFWIVLYIPVLSMPSIAIRALFQSIAARPFYNF